MRGFFSQVLIGYAFIIIDFKLGIDILPDVIGYIIIARAIQKYATSKYNKVAILLSYILGVISIIGMPLIYSIVESSPTEVTLLYAFISGFIELLFYYYLFGIFNSFVQDTPHVNYTKKVKHFVVGSLWLVITLLYITQITQNFILLLLVLIVAIVVIIGVIMFIIYCYRMMKYGKLMELYEKQEKVEPT